ncbi:MAG: hypothetical protein WCO78_03390 [Candidatus Roizmanbacteria bacterium]
MKEIILRHFVFILSTIIILTGFIFFMMPSTTFGFGERCVSNQCGVFFTNIFRARDDLWHMSLAQVAFDTYPFRMPIFSGEMLQSYHFLYSIILMLLTKVSIPVLTGYYLIFPVIWFIVYTLLTVAISNSLFKNMKAVPVFLFFSYFSSNLSFLISIMNSKSFLNDIGWFSNQPPEYMINPTLALSIILVQIILLILLKFRINLVGILALCILTFFVWGSKFYGGVIAVSFIYLYLAALTYYKKLQTKYFILTCIAILISSIIAALFFFNPFASTRQGGVFSLDPFKTIHPIIEDPQLFQIVKLARLRYKLYEHPYLFGPILLIIESFSLALYLLVAFGTRLFSLLIPASKIVRSPLYIAIFGTSFVSVLFASMFTQKGGDWFNTIQFFGYSQFLLQISISFFVVNLLLSRKNLSVVFAVFIIVITFIGSLNSVIEYGKDMFISTNSPIHKIFQPKVYVSSAEVVALAYLSKLPSGITYTFPFTPIADSRPVKQLWKTNDTALVAALGNQQLYEANLQQLDITGINHQKRTLSLKNIQKTNINLLPIRYLYLYKQHPDYKKFIARVGPNLVSLFENDEVEILEKK